MLNKTELLRMTFSATTGFWLSIDTLTENHIEDEDGCIRLTGTEYLSMSTIGAMARDLCDAVTKNEDMSDEFRHAVREAYPHLYLMKEGPRPSEDRICLRKLRRYAHTMHMAIYELVKDIP